MSGTPVDFVSALKALGRPIAYYPVIARSLDSINCAVFLSQLMYWEGKQEDEDGWIRKPYGEVKIETGLGRYELDSVRKKLTALNLLEEQRAGIPARIHYRVNWKLLNEMINKALGGKVKIKVRAQKKATFEPKPKEPTLSYQMKEAFLKQRKTYLPDVEDYNWTKKDWNFIKLTKLLLEKRAVDAELKKNPESKTKPEDAEILKRWEKFLSMLPEYYQKNHYYPSSLFTNFSAIEQAIIADQNGKRKGINFDGAAKAAAQNVPGNNTGPFG